MKPVVVSMGDKVRRQGDDASAKSCAGRRALIVTVRESAATFSALLDDLGLSVRQASDLVGVSAGTIRNYRCGNTAVPANVLDSLRNFARGSREAA